MLFLAFFLILYFYQRTFNFDGKFTQVFFQSLFFAVFIITVLCIRVGLYTFIFLLPLFNSLAPRIGVNAVDIAFYLFIGLSLGFMVGIFRSGRYISYELEISYPFVIFVIILSISAIITIFRYSNFYPLITTRFHNLAVSYGGYRSIGSMLWTLKYYFNYIVGFAFLVIIMNGIKKNRDFFTALRVIVFSSLIVITLGLYQAFFDPNFLNSSFWVKSARINSTLSDPNALGSYMILLFALFFSFILFLKRWYLKIISMVFLGLFVFIGFLSGSRSGFLSIIVSIVIFTGIGLSMTLLRPLRKKIKSPNGSVFVSSAIVILVFILIISLFLGIVFGTGFVEKLDSLKGSGIIIADRLVGTFQDYFESLKSGGFKKAFEIISSGREILWKQAYYMLSDHPVSGVGAGGYFIELPDYHRRYHRGYDLYDFTGNYYLQALSELGLMGALLNFFIFFLVIKKSLAYFLNKNKLRGLKRKDWLLGGLFISFISMIIALFFGSHTNFMEVQLLFWMIIGLMVAYININSRDNLLEPESRTHMDYLDGGQIIGKEYGRSLSVLKTGNYKGIVFGRSSKIILALILIVFFVTLFIGSITDLSINVKQSLYWNEDRRNNYGFYQVENIDGEKARWAGIDASQVIKNNGSELVFSVKNHDPEKQEKPLYVRFCIDNGIVKVLKIDDSQWHEIKIDLSGYSNEKLTFTLACSRGWTPKERGLSNDTRELGVLFRETTGLIK
jgi:O-antigen ligase